MKELLELYMAFLRIGAVNFGGGYAMLPLLERDLNEKRHWVTTEELMDYFAIGQCTPGVIALNVSTFVGYKRNKIAGAAAASMIACCVGGFFPLWYFSSRHNRSSLRMVPGKFEREPLLKASGNGLSEYVGNISFNVLAICYNLQLLRMMGENGVAAYSVLLYYGYIFAAVFIGYNITVTPVIGYNYGAGDTKELRSLLRHSLILLLVLGALMTLVSELSAGPAARLFVGYDPDLSALTKHAIRLYMISFFIAGVNLFTSAWFTGLGNGKVSATVSFIRNLVFELGFVFLLPALLGGDGIWLAVDAADLCCLVLCVSLLLAYRRRYGY